MSATTYNPYTRIGDDVAPLEGLGDAEFRKALIPNLWDDERFAVFMEIELIDQAYDVLKSMVAWVSARVSEYPKKSQERGEWVAKQVQINLRLGQLRDEIKRLNIEEAESIDAKLRRLNRFAFELASALEAAGAIRVLDAIRVDDDCTGMQFLNNYRAKKEARE